MEREGGGLVDGVVELTLETDEPEALERFYREALGLPLLAREDDRIWLAAGERCRLGIWTPGRKEFGDEGGRHVHFALGAAAGMLDEIAERVRVGGAEVEGPVEHDGGDRSLYVRDPAGNVLEIWDFFCDGDGERHGVAALAQDEA